MSEQLGVLVVVVLKARHLPDKHTTRKQHPYARLSISDESECTPPMKRGGQHPEWDHELRFPIYTKGTTKNRVLDVSVWAKEARKDDFLGSAQVDVTETLRRGEYDEWIPLERNGKQRGEIYLEMTLYASEPPPDSRRPSRMLPIFRQFTTHRNSWTPDCGLPPHPDNRRSSSLPPMDDKNIPGPGRGIGFPNPARAAARASNDGLPGSNASPLSFPPANGTVARPRKLRKGMPPEGLPKDQNPDLQYPDRTTLPNSEHTFSYPPAPACLPGGLATESEIKSHPPRPEPPLAIPDNKQPEMLTVVAGALVELGVTAASKAGAQISQALSSVPVQKMGADAVGGITSAVTSILGFTSTTPVQAQAK